MTRNLWVRILALAIGLQMVTGCIAGPELAITPRTVSGKPLQIWTVHTEDKGDSVLVSGIVRRSRLSIGPVPGHLHIVATFADGRPDLIADTRWGSIPPRGSRTGSYFARLPIADAAAISSITLSYAAKADVVDSISGRNP
jgi:hypothetical protein